MSMPLLQRCLFIGLAAALAAVPLFAGGDLGDLGTVQKWENLEVELQGPTSVGLSDTANPFLIEVTATFSGPGGSFAVPAFYAGDGQGGMDGDVWIARFSANAVGDWTMITTSTEPLLEGHTGTFRVD